MLTPVNGNNLSNTEHAKSIHRLQHYSNMGTHATWDTLSKCPLLILDPEHRAEAATRFGVGLAKEISKVRSVGALSGAGCPPTAESVLFFVESAGVLIGEVK